MRNATLNSTGNWLMGIGCLVPMIIVVGLMSRGCGSPQPSPSAAENTAPK